MAVTAGTRWLYAWALGSVAAGAASLLVPLYVVALGGGPLALGARAAGAAAAGAPGAILFGRYADRTGRRRPLVLFSLTVVAAVLAALPALDTVAAVVVANGLLWFAVSAVAPVLTMLVVDATPPSEWTRRIGRLNAYQGYGWAAGLVLGTVWTGAVGRFLSPADARASLFFACAVAAAVAAGSAGRLLPADAGDGNASVSKREGRRVARTLARTARNGRGATFPALPARVYWATRSFHPRRFAARLSRPLTGYLAGVALFSVGFAVFWAPLPLYLVGFGTDGVFALYLAANLASAVLYGPVGEASARADPRLLQTGALGVRAVCFLVVGALGGAFLAYGAVFAAIGATWAVVAVTATAVVTRLSPPSVRGEALGAYASVAAVGGGAGSVLGGWLAAGSFGLAFGAAAALVLVGTALVVATGRDE